MREKKHIYDQNEAIRIKHTLLFISKGRRECRCAHVIVKQVTQFSHMEHIHEQLVKEIMDELCLCSIFRIIGRGLKVRGEIQYHKKAKR